MTSNVEGHTAAPLPQSTDRVGWPQGPGHPDDALLHVLADGLRVSLILDILLANADIDSIDSTLQLFRHRLNAGRVT